MIFNPRFLKWLSDEEDEYGNRRKLKSEAPEDVKKEFEEILELESRSIKNNKLKSTII